MTHQLYTICYDSRYQNDVSVVKRWIDATLELGWQKYGVARPTRRGKDLHTTVFLPPVATGYTSQGLTRAGCCYGDYEDGPVYAEIHYLTPSAWSGDRLGGLDIPVADYHPHYVMHEMSHVVQFGFDSGWYPPTWIIEGLAEYDGFFHTTAYNRTTAIDSLIRYVHRYERERVFCCRTLGNSGIATSSFYYGGAVIMIFLAERFGEGIHVELLTTPLKKVLERRGTTVTKTFDELRAWFEQRVRALGETAGAQLREASRTQLRETPSGGAEGLTAPVFIEDERTSREVSENMRRGTNVGAPVEATSPNGDPLTYSLTDPTNSFTIDPETGQLKTTVPLDYEERSSYEVMVEVSNRVGSASIMVTINVMDENDAPAAKNDTAKTDKNEPVTIAVLANDKDQDGDRLTIIGTTGPANGVVVIGDGATTVTYRPNTGFIGTDTFDYTVSDGTATATARVTVKIQRPLGERINRVNETVLPEVVRAMSASLIEAVTERVEAADSDLNLADQSSLYQVLVSGAQALEAGRPDLGQVLANSSFTLPVKVTEGGGRVGDPALWGRGDYRRLSGTPESPGASADDESQIGWSGNLFSVHLGADDQVHSDLLAGVVLSWSGGRFDYGDDSGASGKYRSQLVSLNPYLIWTSAAGLRLWATVGYGRGEIGFDDEREVGERLSGASMALVAAGASGTLFEDDELIEGGTTSLNLEGEGSLARAFVEGDGDLIESLAVNIQHLRLVLEGSHSQRLASGAALTPSLELALRYDSGAGVNGLGIEVGGGLSYVDPGLGLTLAVTGRGRLLLIDRGGYGEWGVSGLVQLGPRADGRGLFFSLAPTYGEPASRIEQLPVSSVSSYQPEQRVEGRLAAEFGYGLSALGGEALLTPYSGMSLASGESQRFRVGTRFELAESLELSLEGERRTRIGGADHGVTVRGDVLF